MPLLRKETDLLPADFFALPQDAFPWLVVHVRSRQEKTLARHLVRHSVPFYLPLMSSERLRAGRRLSSHVPLFPGYVFLRTDAAQRDVVWRSGAAVSVLDVTDQDQLRAELEQIRRLQIAGASFEPLVSFAPGDAVRITEGAFSGYSGRVIREKGRERLVVDISLLRRSVAVELERTRLAHERK